MNDYDSLLEEDIDSFITRIDNMNRMEMEKERAKISFIMKLHPNKPDLYLKRAMAGRSGDLSIERYAIKDLKLSLSLNPSECTKVLALLNLGVSYMVIKKNEKARKIFSELIELDECWGMFGYSYYVFCIEKNLEKTLEEIKKCLTLTKPGTMVHSYSLDMKAEIYRIKFGMEEKKEYLEIAKELYLKKIKMYPKQISTYVEMGKLYIQLSEPKKGLEYFIKAFEMSPTYAELNFNLGIYYEVYEKKKMKAFKFYCREIEINPTFEESYQKRGEILLSVKKYAESVADFTKAIELQDQESKTEFMNENVFLWRGESYMMLGFLDLAKQDYLRAVDFCLKREFRNGFSPFICLFKFLKYIGDIHYRISEFGISLEYFQLYLEYSKILENKKCENGEISAEKSLLLNSNLGYKEIIQLKILNIHRREDIAEILSYKFKKKGIEDMKERMEYITENLEVSKYFDVQQQVFFVPSFLFDFGFVLRK